MPLKYRVKQVHFIENFIIQGYYQKNGDKHLGHFSAPQLVTISFFKINMVVAYPIE